MNSDTALITSRDDFSEPGQPKRGEYRYWETELNAALKRVREWHRLSDEIVQRYLDQRRADTHRNYAIHGKFSLNLFHSNINTLKSMLYGDLPKVDVSRKFADSDDDVARVAAEILERILNADISENGETYDSVLRATLEDRLLPGLGCARVRYTMEESAPPAVSDGAIDTITQVTSEDAPIEYFHWRDVLWGWARSFAELPWLAYRTYLSVDEATERFGKALADQLKYKAVEVHTKEGDDYTRDHNSPWSKAEIWEIWDKTERKVYWVSIGCDKVLDHKDDPLKLTGFFPSPAFFLANGTTSLYMPTPDFYLAQDLYNEIDVLQTRISILTEAVKAVGVYDAGAEGVKRMFQEGTDNTLIPVDNWAMFAEKGGMQGAVDWLPIQDVVNALDKLIQLRDSTIALLQQVTGMSDVMRGELRNQYEGVDQSRMKAKFGSIRIQALQDEFARFASDLLQIKAEIISRHFEPGRIAVMSNMVNSLDKDKVPAAIALIKNFDRAKLRVTVRPESIAMTDYAELRMERTEFLNALATFMQSANPLLEADPAAKPFVLKMLQWGLAGFKGAQEIEGVIDQAIEASLEAERNKQGQQEVPPEVQMEQARQQGEIQKIQTKAQADMQLREQDRQADMATDQARHEQKIAEIQATMQANLAGIQAKAAADIQTEVIQSQANAAQKTAEAQAELEKDAANMAMELEKGAAEHQRNLTEKVAEHRMRVAEEKAKPKPKSNGGDNA